ncbi:unnamed protein product [Candida verbasci]|uniref:Rad60/SUMO-like domain-containing protein n=1 Tax=Candida verbasci TaxID=1227364 RepID=A0A9W4X9B4_9ASCO|nr:unnamed protein product [Candida verbasci]
MDESKQLSPDTTNQDKTTKKRKKGFLDDDFFSLSASFDKKPKKKKKKEPKLQPKLKTNNAATTTTTISPTIPQEFKPESNEAINGLSQSPMEPNFTDKSNSNTSSILPSSISAPPIDRQKIRREIEKKINAEQKHFDSISSDSEDDDLFEQILKQQSIKKSPSVTIDPKVYTFDNESERKRKYTLRVTSKLPVPGDSNSLFQVDFGVGGLKKFDKVLTTAVSFFKNKFKDILSPIHLSRYDVNQNELIWCEGKVLVKRFYTPKTFRILPNGGNFDPEIDNIELVTPTLLNFYLVSSDVKNNFQYVFPELNTRLNSENTFEEEEEKEEEQIESSSDDDEFDDVAMEETKDVINVDDESEEFFKIGLKGQDNKRLEVKVNPKTKLMNLLVYYLKQKNIDQGIIGKGKVKMIFDDEAMNLNETVGDTELEEDFEIQIVIKN